MKLEQKRSLLENLEIIEDAIAERFRRNPSLYYNYLPVIDSLLHNKEDQILEYPKSIIESNQIYRVSKIKRSRKQSMLQQHEIKLFLKDRNDIINKIDNIQQEEIIMNVDEMSTFKDTIKNIIKTKDSFHKAKSLKDKISEFAMFSSEKDVNVHTTILSERATDLNINDIFTREEQYGEIIQLENFHNDWLNVIKSPDCTVLEFLNLLSKTFIINTYDSDHFHYLSSPPVDRKNDVYQSFINKLANYVQDFFYRKYPLVDREYIEIEMKKQFDDTYINKPLIESSNRLFCVVCNKTYNSTSVFETHLAGKFHQKHSKNKSDFYMSEFKLHKYLNLLKDVVRSSIELVERKLAFTVEERLEELERVNKIYDSPVYGPDETEVQNEDKKNIDDDKDSNDLLSNGSFNMPLGPDGTPMPYWLYKLQGLDVSYACEICSNQEYQGRRAYEKHFREPTHEYHLKCLGITPSPIFKGITKIEEAQSLWKQINSSTSVRNAAITKARVSLSEAKSTNNNSKKGTPKVMKMEIEVEDDEGNVMTERVYNDLKKQGLL